MDNKYVKEVLKKELKSLEKEKLGIEELQEDGNELSSPSFTEWVNKELREVNAKINEIEFHIDFV